MQSLINCWQRRWVRGILWTSITLVTLCALIYAGLNSYGARRLKNALTAISQQGETANFDDLLPSPLPDTENFCAIEPLKNLALEAKKNAEVDEKRKRLESLNFPASKNREQIQWLAGQFGGQPLDLGATNAWLRKVGWRLAPEESTAENPASPAIKLLAGISKEDALFEELARGLSRLEARWTPEWKGRDFSKELDSAFYHQYSALRGLQWTLFLRGVAAAHASDRIRAYESALLLARLTQASLQEPTLGSSFISVMGARALCGIVWEVCESQVGTIEDFEKIESALSRLDIRQNVLVGFRGEIAPSYTLCQLIKTERDRYVTLFFHPYFNQPAQWHRLVLNAFPAGLFQATEATALEEKLKLLLSIRDQSLEAALRNQQRMTTEQEEAQKSIWGNILHRNIGLSMPAYAEILRHAVYTQTIINQARIACALERHRLEKGSYPDSLEELQGLAGSAALLDAASGKPMRYRRVEGRKYALWSIGLDGVDHGGKRGEGDKASKKAYVEGDDFVGDWVWDFPGK